MSHISTVTGEVLTLASDGQHYFGIQKLSNANDAGIHSCLLFDAASIADGLQHQLQITVPALSADLHLVQIRVRSWLADFNAHFLSRAPPL
ncbi:hypothetical protein [Undibacterium fentianense]|uniref:Uncharacterized protein n=1 Tax=Undibacterium fentianense TaxID=2828728 RepID=A0A941ICQ5_9BURK|nr:hypothetical protein [Undibacterium fentianense]MBR7800449.1 hypothetical protein [Undibacterium fentianense]